MDAVKIFDFIVAEKELLRGSYRVCPASSGRITLRDHLLKEEIDVSFQLGVRLVSYDLFDDLE